MLSRFFLTDSYYCFIFIIEVIIYGRGDNVEKINDRITTLFNELGIKQFEFANQIGVTQSYISKLFKDNSNVIPSDRVLKLICQKFNVNEEWIRTGHGEMFKSEGEFLELFASKLDDLDELDRKIISEYIKLSPEQRIVIKDFIKKMTT